jgi:hypothetical protein
MTGHQVSTSKSDDPSRKAAILPEFVEDASRATPASRAMPMERVDVAAARYGNPGAVLRDPKLTVEQKRKLLRQWAFDAYRFEVATTEGMPQSAPSGLDEAIDALIDLDRDTSSISNLSRMHSATGGRRAQAV